MLTVWLACSLYGWLLLMMSNLVINNDDSLLLCDTNSRMQYYQLFANYKLKVKQMFIFFRSFRGNRELTDLSPDAFKGLSSLRDL